MMASTSAEPLCVERVWLPDEEWALSISHVLDFVTMSGTEEFGCFTLRFAEGTRMIRAQSVFEPRPWVTYYRGPVPGEYFLKVETDSAGRLQGEVVTREDIELETDDVSASFYE
jgi:hypothetical protein